MRRKEAKPFLPNRHDRRPSDFTLYTRALSSKAFDLVKPIR